MHRLVALSIKLCIAYAIRGRDILLLPRLVKRNNIQRFLPCKSRLDTIAKSVHFTKTPTLVITTATTVLFNDDSTRVLHYHGIGSNGNDASIILLTLVVE